MENLILVEGGTFLMGDTYGYEEGWPDEGWLDERPVHEVSITYDYWLGKYPTTFDQYDIYVETMGNPIPSDEGWGYENRPTINVSWWDTIQYCNWLSDIEKLARAYNYDGNLINIKGDITKDIKEVVGYRLPTEAEWEYAAKGGRKSKGYDYPGGDNIEEVGWYKFNSGLKTQIVGTKRSNELELYDMAGNVQEWCHDWYDVYSSNKQIDPIGLTSNNINNNDGRVQRGGCYYYFSTGCRVSYRDCDKPLYIDSSVGFRIAKTLTK